MYESILTAAAESCCLLAAFAACYQKHVKWYALVVFAVLWISTALSFFLLPEVGCIGPVSIAG